MKILIINGPNLNMLGRRDPEQYGNFTYTDLIRSLEAFAVEKKIELEVFQSNHEGELIDKIHDALDTKDGLVINPGALTHYSYALRDALEMLEIPKVEVHLSNIFKREEFRHKSTISPVCDGVISGLGAKGYFLAIEYILEK
ncbi:MAG TPA: type II 3-dehydroquinate dehydratase [Thermotogota bacterium]|nr:type II 3-dehydroquinate dehydratase [Thermotogota bacterium]HPJ88871.1 type II 3-dehydroquinate dehydratase [Thermotogota bacterium]HPR96155.1 type II 3-dehydroquinate dehydratase [Thermotogota bacterium]